jgi:hypothetical protein
MGYQYIENFKNCREVVIREYEDTDPACLPDERYQIKLRYFDNAQLNEERKAYDVQLKSFEIEIQHLWEILETVYQGKKSSFKVCDFEDLAEKQKRQIKKTLKDKTGTPLYEDIAKVWDGISFVKPAETDVEKSNRTYTWEKDRIRQRIIMIRNRIKDMYDYLYPLERRVMEDRLSGLEKDFSRFDYMINPYHLQPGLLLDVDITSIKRKKATLDSFANVLTEFLHSVSKGFQNAALASFNRRGSVSREDINPSFDSSGMSNIASILGSLDGAAAEDADEDTEDAASPPRTIEAPPVNKKVGIVDSGKKGGGAKKNRGDYDGIAEL